MKYMVFLNWIDDFLEKAGDIIGKFFNIIWAFLCSIIYGLITGLFNIFDRLTNMDLLDQSNININGIYQRMTMIITIIMIFYITFEFIKYVLQPDTINDKEKGVEGIIKRIVIAILLIAFIPTVFTTAMKLQDRILETNVIPKVIFGQKDFDYKNAGSNFAGDVFAAFYRVNYEECTTKGDCKEAKAEVERVVGLWKGRNGLGALITAQGKQLIDITNTSVQFDGLLAVIFGCFTLYVIFLYCIDLGVRFVQLLFLQIIAPVAAISYIIPQKDSMLNKWIKQVTTTYLDVFIRYAVLYFMLLIVSILSSSMDFYELSSGGGDQIDIIMYIFIIMGLLIFVQRAPKLIEELFPKSSGAASIGFGFSGKSRFEPLGKSITAIKKPIAATAGAVAGVARTAAAIKSGKLTSNIKGDKFKDKLNRGLTRGWSAVKAGYKGAAAGAKSGRFGEATMAGRQSVQSDEALVNKGGTVLGHDFYGGRYQDIKVQRQVEIENLENMTTKKKAVSTSVENMKFRKQMDSIGAAITASGNDSAARAWEGEKKKVEKLARRYADGKIDEAKFKSEMTKVIDDYNAKNSMNVSHFAEDDLELNNSAKWGAITTAINEAKVAAKEIQRMQYKDKNNASQTIGYDEATFAEEIGDYSDKAETAASQIKADPKYKEANANANEGKK